MLSAAAERAIWSKLDAAGAASGRRQDIAQAIEAAIATYKRATSATLPPGREEQLKNARKIHEAVRALERCIGGADRETLKRLYLGIADKGTSKKKNMKEKREEAKSIEAGKEWLRECLDTLDRISTRAIGRAGRKKSSKGAKSAAPARLPFVADLAAIWERFTGKRFEGNRKDNRKAGGSKYASRDFIDCVLREGLGLDLTFGQLSNLVTRARRELDRRGRLDPESEESEANVLEE